MRTASFSSPEPSEVLRGVGVHSGKECAVRISRGEGPVRVRAGGGAVPMTELRIADTVRSTGITVDGCVVRTVEHLFAAFAGLSVYEGASIDIEGEELPLLDGGARTFAEALARLDVRPSSPLLEVARPGTVEVFESRYEFREGDHPVVEVVLDFGDAPLAKTARWDGDPGDFLLRIAPARTFALEHEIVALGEASLARFADPGSVIVVGKELHGAGVVAPDEPARHKLLDFMGDAYVVGGPPRGTIVAHRPGHRSNHAALRAAIDRGILRPRS